MVNIKIEEIKIFSDDLKIEYELLGKSYMQDKLQVKLIKNTEKGSPDFKYFKYNRCYYIEFKANNDGLRKDQIRWILNHPDVDVTLLWVNVVRSKDYDILSANTYVNNKIPLLKYNNKLDSCYNTGKNRFMVSLNNVFDCNKSIPISELVGMLSTEYGLEYTLKNIDELINEGYLFKPNDKDIERL